jgi:hypothetical protein
MSSLICFSRPYRIGFGDVHVFLLDCDVSANYVLEALNHSVVGLVYYPNISRGHGKLRLSYLSEDFESYPQCLGLGLVRGVDVLSGSLHVLTPLRAADLCLVNGLVLSRQVVSGLLCGGGLIWAPYVSSMFSGKLLSGQRTRRNLLRVRHKV